MLVIIIHSLLNTNEGCESAMLKMLLRFYAVRICSICECCVKGDHCSGCNCCS